MRVDPVTLHGRTVRLEPLSESHHAALCEVGLDPELWRWIPHRVTTPEEMAGYIRTAFDWQRPAQRFPSRLSIGSRAASLAARGS